MAGGQDIGGRSNFRSYFEIVLKDVVQSPLLEILLWTCGTKEHGCDGLTAGLDDLGGLFQP